MPSSFILVIRWCQRAQANIVRNAQIEIALSLKLGLQTAALLNLRRTVWLNSSQRLRTRARCMFWRDYAASELKTRPVNRLKEASKRLGHQPITSKAPFKIPWHFTQATVKPQSRDLLQCGKSTISWWQAETTCQRDFPLVLHHHASPTPAPRRIWRKQVELTGTRDVSLFHCDLLAPDSVRCPHLIAPACPRCRLHR